MSCFSLLCTSLISCKDNDEIKEEIVNSSEKDKGEKGNDENQDNQKDDENQDNQKDDEETAKLKTQKVSDLIKTLTLPNQEDVYNRTSETRQETIEENGVIIICDCQDVERSEEFNENILLDPSTSSIYPGSILDGNTIITGGYRLISLDRSPLTISTDFFNKNGNSSVKVENPTLSGIREGIKSLMYNDEINGATAANTTFFMEEVNSEEELSLAIGASVKFLKKANITENFDFNNKSKKTHILIKLVQQYYTVDIDEPATIDNFFAENVTAYDLKKELENNIAPVYVSSVKYGRIAYFAVESSESSKDVKNELNAQFKAWGVKVNAETNLEKKIDDSKTTITGTVLGGSGEKAVSAVATGLQGMLDFITTGGNFSKESPASPIAFTVKSFATREVFATVNSAKYTVRNCHGTKASIQPVYFEYISGPTDYVDLYGNFYVEAGFNNKIGTFWNKDESHAIRCKYGEQTTLTYNSELSLNLNEYDNPNLNIRFIFDFHLTNGTKCKHDYYPYELILGDNKVITKEKLEKGLTSDDIKKDSKGHYYIEFESNISMYECPGKETNHNINKSKPIIYRIGFDVNL